MARKFVIASSQYLLLASAPVTAPPFTIAGFVKVDAASGSQEIMSIGHSATGLDRHDISAQGNGTKCLIRVRTIGSSGAVTGASDSGITVSPGTWYHVAGVWASTSSRTCYLSGAAQTANTTSATPAVTPDRTSVGMRLSSGTPGVFIGGSVAELALWSIALSADDIASLAKGFCPLLVRSESLVAYWPLGGMWGQADYDHWKRAYDMTPYPAAPNAPTWADHPPGIIYPPGVSL